MNWKPIAGLVLAALIGAGAGAGVFAWYEWRNAPASESLRPAFVLPDLQDNPQSVSQWDGKLLVINFWATWCPPCVREIPMFVDLQREYGEQGLQFVGIALDHRDKAQAFAERLGVNYPLLYGVQPVMEVGMMYGNEAGTLPFTVVIDRSGRIRHVFGIEVHREQLEPIIQQLL